MDAVRGGGRSYTPDDVASRIHARDLRSCRAGADGQGEAEGAFAPCERVKVSYAGRGERKDVRSPVPDGGRRLPAETAPSMVTASVGGIPPGLADGDPQEVPVGVPLVQLHQVGHAP